MKKPLFLMGLISIFFVNALPIPNSSASLMTPTHPTKVSPVWLTEDVDEDGLTWWEEMRYGTDPRNPDTDGDFLTDGGEDPDGPGGTDPANPDTDGDSYCDSWEKNTGTIATDPTSYPYWDGAGTSDGSCPTRP